MNKIYKVVWSKAKQCYVVASELAKNHTRGAKSEVSRKILVTGVLTCLFSFSVYNPVFAEIRMQDGSVTGFDENVAKQISLNHGAPTGGSYHSWNYSMNVYVKNDGTVVPRLTWRCDFNQGDGNIDTLVDSFDLSDSELSQLGINPSAFDRGASYTADNGIDISSDNKVSVKAGTNVTVDENGVSVTGNGSVSSGNTGLINGGTAYSELRPSANGNYVIQLELYNFISSFPLFCSFLTIP